MNDVALPVYLSLTFDPGSDTTRITWEADPIGTRQSQFVSPYQGAGLALVARVLDTLQSGHANYSDAERQHLMALDLMDTYGRVFTDTHQRVGRALYAALIADSEGAKALDMVRNYATAQAQPVGLVLHFPPNAVELAALPWELLWGDDSTPLLLSGRLMASCTRHLDLPHALPPMPANRLPLRLLAISPQADIPNHVRQQERTARQEALQPLIDHGQLVLVAEISPATRQAVVDGVQQHAPDIVHYYGHGRYTRGQGALLFDRPDGGPSWTPVDRLMPLLGGVRMVLLHACQGAMVSEAGLLTGIAPALSSVGVPLVVAMQQSIRIPAATRASSILYRALAQEQSIQHAVSQARQALYIEEEDQVSWFVPTLYIRSRDTGPARLIGEQSGAASRQPDSQDRASTSARIFISYKRHVDPDETLALQLYGELTQAGHEPFIDQTMTIGTEWALEIEQQIAQSDFLLVLLSDASVQSEMVAKEIEFAHRQSRVTGKARILPVRVAYTEPLPYQLSVYLDRIHYAEWFHETDTLALIQQVLAAVSSGHLLPSSPMTNTVPPTPRQAIPRPAADPRFLQGLPEPGGAVEMDSTLYIERDSDGYLRDELQKPGRTLTTIRAPRQSGKSSLLIQGIAAAQQRGSRVAFIDLQFVDQGYLENLDSFLYYFGTAVLAELGLDTEAIEPFWSRSQAPTMKFTTLMERHILAQDDSRLVLAIDEADRLLHTDFRDTFYGAVRAWHNRGAHDRRWKRVDIVLAISTEPHLLIHDVHQSPFNVGSRIHLDDFTPDQVTALSQRYRLSLDSATHAALLNLLNGHPYLTSKAMYMLVKGGMDWEQLQRDACDERGPFGDHLRRYLWLLRDEPDLQQAFKQIIHTSQCPDEVAFYRLSQAGLVQHARSAGYSCRCKLYADYFGERL